MEKSLAIFFPMVNLAVISADEPKTKGVMRKRSKLKYFSAPFSACSESWIDKREAVLNWVVVSYEGVLLKASPKARRAKTSSGGRG